MKIQKIRGLVHIHIVLLHQGGHKHIWEKGKHAENILGTKPDRNIKTGLKARCVRVWTAFNELTTRSSGGQL
jgi:hypothetical protein